MNHFRFIPPSRTVGVPLWRRLLGSVGVPIVLLAVIGVFSLVLAPDNSVRMTNSVLVAKPVATPVAPAGNASHTAPVQVALSSPIITPAATLVPQLKITTPNILPTTAGLAPTTNPYTSFVPVRFKIPTIGVDTFVEGVGQTQNGAMDVPKNVWNVAWYKLGPHPGERGSAVIAGHLDSSAGIAIFWHLSDLQPGAKIYVTDTTNRQLEFEVVNKAIFAYTDPTAVSKIFDYTTPAMLNLITCNGTYDRKTQNYSDRLVVFSTFIGPVSK